MSRGRQRQAAGSGSHATGAWLQMLCGSSKDSSARHVWLRHFTAGGTKSVLAASWPCMVFVGDMLALHDSALHCSARLWIRLV